MVLSRRFGPAAVAAWLVSVSAPQTLPASDFDVAINEIHYNPFSGLAEDEYVELHNRGGNTVDLSGWLFGEGIVLLFPAGTLIGPKEYLLVSPDAAYTRDRYGVDSVVGNYTGRLDNGGEILSLFNAGGDMISRVHYGDGGIWPSSPDGLGASLELIDPHGQTDQFPLWRGSLFLGGSPGAPNSRLIEQTVSPRETVILRDDELWRYIRGTEPYPPGWRETGFDDATWDQGATGIGYGDDDDRTVLTDMEDRYLSFAARKTFVLTAGDIEATGELTLEVDYDDGFVAWLNGTEVARANLGAPGTEVPFDAQADGTREAGSPEPFFVPKGLLEAGTNVLAVQLHNADAGSSDASFIPRLVSFPVVSGVDGDELAAVVVNEVKPTGAAGSGFIELLNRSVEEIDISGFRIIDSAGRGFAVPGGTRLASGEHRVFEDSQLGFDLLPAGIAYALLEDDGLTLVDALDPRAGRPGDNGFSFGRFPDGDDDGFVMVTPTPGEANEVEFPSHVVVNEISFHPPAVPPDADCARNCSDPDQWIELHNRAGTPAVLDGWSLTKAVDFAFPAGLEIPPGGYLVVASSRERFVATHPGFPPGLVVGDWTRDLAHDTDTINLRDDLGNLVDHVKYGDGGPRNDEDPEDDIDDRTFLGTDWPTDADGSGRTLELVHPALENRFGGSWTEGPVGGTPGAANAGFDPAPPPVVGRVTHDPALPGPAQEVTVTCSVSAVGSPVASVRAIWHVDGGGPSGEAVLRDDGLSGDGLAGDGIYGGAVPAQASRAVVAYRIEARLADGRSVVMPRPPEVPPYAGFDGPFFLYQVLGGRPSTNGTPEYYIIMTEADQDELESRELFSNVLLYATFIGVPRWGGPVVRNLAGVRYRGSGTRDEFPRSYRIELPPENAFQEIRDLNLNSQDIDREMLAGDLFRRAGFPTAETWIASVTFQGVRNPRYVRKERIDREFLERAFGPASDGGNLYRGLNPDDNETFPFQADLTYLGEDPDEYRPYYIKRTNREEDDYSDVIELTRTLDPAETPDDVFPGRLEAIADVFQWARFFAVQALIANEDGGIQNRSGEDYFLYRVPETSNRRDAGKWILLPWDIEETFDDDDEPLFRPRIPAVRRFLTHPRYAALYYCNLTNLRHGVFSRREMRLRFRLIDFLFTFGEIDAIDSYIAARLGFLDENIPTALTTGASPIPGDELIPVGADWSFFRGTREPSGGSLAWTTVGFDDATWPEGPSGFGYGDGDDATLLDDMEDNYTTVYIRHVFDVPDPALVDGLELHIDYDDGFVAFLNGVEVARSGLGDPGTFVPFNDVADGLREAGNVDVEDLAGFLGLIEAGSNVLAIQGANENAGSSDFSLIPELTTGSRSSGAAGCGGELWATSEVIGLSGRSDACRTATVEVGGQPAEWDPVSAAWRATTPLDPGDNTITIRAFDPQGRLLETLEVVVHRLAGDLTAVSGALAGDIEWTPGGGPYLMEDDVLVPPGATLTIRPGTVVFGQGGASIIVEGRIAAAGTDASPIVFRPLGCDNRFGGIAMDGTGAGEGDPTHLLRHVDFRFGDNPGGFAGCVAPVGAKLVVENCTFDSITANAIDGTDARVEVRDSSFVKTYEGIHCTSSTVFVTGSRFEGMIGDRDAIDFDLNGTERSLIEDCVFLDGSDDGVDLGDTTVDIRDNVFLNIQDKAISLEGNGPLGPPSVTGNLIVDCGTAIAAKNGVTVTEGHHNTLVGNVEGVSLFAKGNAPDGGHGTFHSMIVWNNTFDVRVDGLSTVSFSFSDISEMPWPGEGNISQDPEFTNARAGDFSLRAGSPCIRTGKPAADGTLTDMGAIPFTGPESPFIRADADGNASVELTDVIFTLDLLFRGGPGSACVDRIDANDDGDVDISDSIYTLIYLFTSGGPEPPAPFPGAGQDPTPDDLRCF